MLGFVQMMGVFLAKESEYNRQFMAFYAQMPTKFAGEIEDAHRRSIRWARRWRSRLSSRTGQVEGAASQERQTLERGTSPAMKQDAYCEDEEHYLLPIGRLVARMCSTGQS